MEIYIPEEVNKKVKRFGLQDKLSSITESISKEEDVTLFHPIPPYWKRRIDPYRVIGQVKDHNGIKIFFIIDIMKRDENSYLKFCKDPKKYGQNNWQNLVTNDDIEKFLKNLESPPPQREILPDKFYPWLNCPQIEDSSGLDYTVLESEVWVRRFCDNNYYKYWQDYYDLIHEAIVNDHIVNRPNYCSKKDRGILYCKVENRNDSKVLFLIAPLDNDELQNKEKHNSILAQIYPDYDRLINNLTRRKVLRLSRRAYPDYMLADRDAWLHIQGTTESNLALSGEEEELLQLSCANNGLPLFINGRAGSGKSTMLMFLFAEYIRKKEKEDLTGEPLFLTYSERLVREVQEGVERLIKSQHQHLAESNESEFVTQIAPGFVKKSIRRFDNFLKELLPRDKILRYQDDHKISFNRFKQLYTGQNLPANERRYECRLPERNSYSSEICWHVIRTYIKGYSWEGFASPEDYQEAFNRGDQSIELDDFRRIYETIWQNWYSNMTQERGYWDEQDLVRDVLENWEGIDLGKNKYSAIFCDESQDFTRIELYLIMKLFYLSKFEIPNCPPCLPFAFAGDPFQTVNPTGFRWPNMKAAFYEEILTPLNPMGTWGLQMNLQNLKYNYRSASPIVRVANTVLLWRRVLFDQRELEPQPWWQMDSSLLIENDGLRILEKQQDELSYDAQSQISDTNKIPYEPDPLFFNLDKSDEKAIIKALKDNLIIVPTELGGEWDFVQNDDLLRKVVDGENDQKGVEDPPQNVLSAAEVKGCDFEKVILYKFGDKVPGNRNLDELSGLEIEYFLNKLYVASSRPTQALFVVDTQDGYNKLWTYAIERLESFLKQVSDENWSDYVGGIKRGTAENINEMYTRDRDWIANKLKQQGMNKEKPDLLRRAKQYFQQMGRYDQADLCEAWALRYECRYIESGEIFLKINKWEEAWFCFRKGVGWKELRKWYKMIEEKNILLTKEQRIILPLVEFINKSAESNNINALSNFVDSLIYILENKELGSPFDKLWNECISDFQKKVLNFVDVILKENKRHTALFEFITSIKKVLIELRKANYEIDGKLLGLIYFILNDFSEAVNELDRANYKGKELKICEAELSLKNDNLHKAVTIFYNIPDYQRVLDITSSTEDKELLYFRSLAYSKNNQYDEAIQVIQPILEQAKDTNDIKAYKDYSRLKAQCHEALNQTELAFNIFKEIKAYEDAIRCGKKLSLTESELLQLEAEKYRHRAEFDKAIDIYKKLKNEYKVYWIKGHERKYYRDLDSALKYFLEAEAWREAFFCLSEIVREKGTNSHEIYLFFNKAKEMDAQNFYEEEKKAIKEWADLLRRDEEEWEQVIAPQELAWVYEKFGNYLSARDFYQMYMTTQSWARQGWLRIREEQASYHEKRSHEFEFQKNKTDAENENQKAAKIREDIKRKKEEWEGSGPEIIFKKKNTDIDQA